MASTATNDVRTGTRKGHDPKNDAQSEEIGEVSMEPEELEEALRQFDALARMEYRIPLSEVATGRGSKQTRLIRLGRLIGILLKEPFATSQDLHTPSSFTGAYRSWEFKSEAVFQDQTVRSSWQYQALEALRSDPGVIEGLGMQYQTVYDLSINAHHERGFFTYFVASCHRYLCEAKLRSTIKKQVSAVQRSGLDIKHLTPEMIVSSGGLTIGAALVHSVPALGMMGAPVIAGLIYVLYSIGIDALCEWAADHKLDSANSYNADKERK